MSVLCLSAAHLSSNVFEFGSRFIIQTNFEIGLRSFDKSCIRHKFILIQLHDSGRSHPKSDASAIRVTMSSNSGMASAPVKRACDR